MVVNFARNMFSGAQAGLVVGLIGGAVLGTTVYLRSDKTGHAAKWSFNVALKVAALVAVTFATIHSFGGLGFLLGFTAAIVTVNCRDQNRPFGQKDALFLVMNTIAGCALGMWLCPSLGIEVAEAIESASIVPFVLLN